MFNYVCIFCYYICGKIKLCVYKLSHIYYAENSIFLSQMIQTQRLEMTRLRQIPRRLSATVSHRTLGLHLYLLKFKYSKDQ